MRRVTEYLAVYLGLSILLGLVFLALSYPWLPSTPGQWLALCLLALPVQLLAEFIGNFLWNNPLAQSVDRSTSHRSLSLLRIGYGVFAVLACIGLAFAALHGWRLLMG